MKLIIRSSQAGNFPSDQHRYQQRNLAGTYWEEILDTVKGIDVIVIVRKEPLNYARTVFRYDKASR